MKRIYTPLFILITLFVSCSMPKADVTIEKMNRYWDFYRVDNIDSLKTFYIAPIPDTSFWNGLHEVRVQYGDVKKVSLINTTVATELGKGERIELTYEVEYDKKALDHILIFKKDDKGDFKISRHELTK